MTALIIIIFIAGYGAIAFEHQLHVNKTASALIVGVCCWMVYILFSPNKELVTRQLIEDLGEYAGILFFLMGAMTIVEIIDAHDGFEIITRRITQTNKRKLLWLISGITFFLSPVLDNLTTAIVMVSLLQKIVQDEEDQLYFVSMIIIAANAGGAWSPIGDVTTTMLWLGGQITAWNIIKILLLPAVISLVVPLLIISPRLKGNVALPSPTSDPASPVIRPARQWLLLCCGALVLVLVPVFKTLTHLPPYMGILLGLGILWVITESVSVNHETEERFHLSPAYALRKIDSPSILFFLGILLSIAVLQRAGILAHLAQWMDARIANLHLIVGIMGLLSSIVDNVPLMAAAQGMYPLQAYPTDAPLWEFLAYCTGTGGSILIIGSAAGVAVMGMARVQFFWYLKKISWIALLGYLAGAFSYLVLERI